VSTSKTRSSGCCAIDCARLNATNVFPSPATPLVRRTLFSWRVAAILYKRERRVRNRSGPSCPGLELINTLWRGSSCHSSFAHRFANSSKQRTVFSFPPAVSWVEIAGLVNSGPRMSSSSSLGTSAKLAWLPAARLSLQRPSSTPHECGSLCPRLLISTRS